MRRFCLSNPRRGRGLTPDHSRLGFTLVEMLVAMAITLVMMAAVVTLFANISGSVRNRRATAELSGQLRHVRNVLRSEEHTSELQSQSNLVCRLLLEKKKYTDYTSSLAHG